jgi:hypothetical protein
MDLKSFFNLEKVTFNKKELEAPYKDKRFNKDNNPYENKPTSPIFSRENLQK